MPNLFQNFQLKPYNTFQISAYAKYFTTINSVEDFFDLQKQPEYLLNEILIIGGGSNILFTQNFDGLIIKNSLKGIEIMSENENEVFMRAAAGENWHELVLFCVNNNYGGIENLSLIPGCVGASPMQNIGAYGVEIKDVFQELEAYHLKTGVKTTFSHSDCEFGYRESIFKNKYKNEYLITSVTFKLRKKPVINTSYGAINDELELEGITLPTIKDVSTAVIKIRLSKLPDPSVIGNAGSFFKNPEVSQNMYLQLKSQFENLVAYKLPNGKYKLAAGWLIEQCGLKGYEIRGAAVHTKQALVLINLSNTSGLNVLELSNYVIKKVFDTFGVTLEREVNIL
jgi:UDP-N-acetylmuramate dehydrogenase